MQVGLDQRRIPNPKLIQRRVNRQVGTGGELLLYNGGYKKQEARRPVGIWLENNRKNNLGVWPLPPSSSCPLTQVPGTTKGRAGEAEQCPLPGHKGEQ